MGDMVACNRVANFYRQESGGIDTIRFYEWQIGKEQGFDREESLYIQWSSNMNLTRESRRGMADATTCHNHSSLYTVLLHFHFLDPGILNPTHIAVHRAVEAKE